VGLPDDILLAWDVTLREAPPFRLVLVGDGILAYRDLLTARLPRAQRLDVVPALAPAIAEVARRRAESGLAVPPHAVKPIYVRRPDAELARDRRARSTPAPDGPGGDACP
jgi:tRNA A37 threonylcarbamoyladenosine modification protein TsaB